MAPSPGSIDLRRPSWRRPRAQGEERSRRRWRLRLAAVAGLALLLAILGYAVLRPFAHARTAVFLLAPEYDPLVTPPLEYLVEDAAAFGQLAPALEREGDAAQLQIQTFRSRGDLLELDERIHQAANSGADVLIVYVAAHGVVRDGQPYLLGSDPGAGDDRVHFGELLRTLSQSRAATKLLLLDAGRATGDARLDDGVGRFTQLVRREIESFADPSLWVLASCDLLQRSQVSPALRRSVFGYFTVQGLRGAADADGDEVVDLEELHRFVAGNVRSFVSQTTGGAAVQTPWLARGAGAAAERANPELVSVYRLGDAAAGEAVSDAIVAAREANQTLGIARVPSGSDITSRATRAVLPQQGIAGRAATAGQSIAARSAAEKSSAAAEEAATTPPETTPAAQTESAQKAPSPTAASGTFSAAADSAQQSPEALLVEAWRLRDELEQPAGDTGSRPIDYAPHRWRVLESQLLAWEAQLNDAASDRGAITAELQATVNALASLLPEGSSEVQLQQSAASRALLEEWAILAPAVHPAGAAPLSLIGELRLARIGGRPAPEPLQKTEEQLRHFAEQGVMDEFVAWAAAIPSEVDGYREVWFARRLAAVSKSLDWPVARLALRVSLAESEAAAVAPPLSGVWAAPWGAQRIVAADRLRREAERELFDRIGAGAIGRAGRLFEQAIGEYAAARQEIGQAEAGIRVYNETAHRAPYYLDAFAFANVFGDAPSKSAAQYEELRSLLAELDGLAAILDQPHAHTASKMEHHVQRLLAVRTAVEAHLQPRAIEPLTSSPAAPGEALAMSQLLGAPLPGAAVREQLLRTLTPVDAAVAGRFGIIASPDSPPPTLPPSLDAWRRAARWRELQLRLARHAVSKFSAESECLADLSQVESAAQRVRVETADDAAAESLGEAHARFDKALRDLYSRLPERIAVASAAEIGSPDALSQLQYARRALRLLPAREAARVRAAPALRILEAWQWRAYWLWQRERVLAARDDAPPAEQSYVHDAAQHFRMLAEQISLRPPTPAQARPSVEIATVATASLRESSLRDFTVTFRLQGAERADVWVLLKYDPQLLEVRVSPEDRVVREHALPADRGPYPYRPDRLQYPATFTLRAGVEQPLKLRVTSLGSSDSASRLIVKALAVNPSPTAEDEGKLLAYDRKAIELLLPLPQTLDLQVGGPRGSWSRAEDGLAFYPFPNQRTEYQLSLVNRLDRPRRVDVAFLIPSRIAEIVFPSAEMTAGEAQALLGRLQPTSITSLENLPLPAGDTPVPLPFPPSPEEQEPESPAAGAGETPPPAASSAPAEATIKAIPLAAPIAIPRELLVQVTDVESQRVWLRRLTISPQRPRRYVRPEVRYDPAAERVTVRITADDPSLLPGAGSTVRFTFLPPLPPAAEMRSEGRIDATRPTALLYAEVTRRDSPATLFLHVDDYPRAFVYRIDPSRSSGVVAEDADALAARIVSVPEGVRYPAPVAGVPVMVEIDAPPGSFHNGGDLVEIGIDKDRDREFAGDDPLEFASDRQASATLSRIGPQGAFAIDTQVTDFHVTLPDPGLVNMKANVLAHVIAGGRDAWSEPVEVMFDAGPPLVKKLELSPGRKAVMGSEIEIRVWTSDHELSGVAKVEAALDLNRNGEIPPEPPPVAAALSEPGLWKAKLPAAPPGTFTLLLRVTDAVGNAVVLPQGKIQVITPEELAAEQAALTNRVSGVVVYGDLPQAGIEVSLSTEDGRTLGPVRTNERGEFEFPRVPLGAWSINASGLVNGAERVFPFDGEAKTVEVIAPPKRVPDLRLPLKIRRPPK